MRSRISGVTLRLSVWIMTLKNAPTYTQLVNAKTSPIYTPLLPMSHNFVQVSGNRGQVTQDHRAEKAMSRISEHRFEHLRVAF